MKARNFRLGIEREQTGLTKNYARSCNVGGWLQGLERRASRDQEIKDQTGPVRVIVKDGKPFHPSNLSVTSPKEDKSKDSKRRSDKS